MDFFNSGIVRILVSLNYQTVVRKISAAIIICLLLFNWFGYRFVTDYMEHKADTRLETRLDNNHYDESQLIQLKVPIDLPYQTTWAAFERFDGEIEMNGILYKYVKRKLVNDTLILLCIPNHKKMELQTARNDFFKTTNDISQNNSKKPGSNTATFKKLMSDYDDHSYGLNLLSLQYQPLISFSYSAGELLHSPHISPEQPPDRVV